MVIPGIVQLGINTRICLGVIWAPSTSGDLSRLNHPRVWFALVMLCRYRFGCL